MMDEKSFPIEEVFNSAVSIVQNLPKDGKVKPSDGLKLKLYALFKQATHGPNDTPKPIFYKVVEVYKWNAWSRLGDMPKEEAMRNYIEKLRQVMDTIPIEDSDLENFRYLENVMGKTFYDYCKSTVS